ncbi:MAG TPA: HAMP domain-containing sensor histidine kinase [Acidimicrobiia bacterium]|nr:HAMP domain-containing sensor histidine kinase [Acidimicrobiia bacterium]
MSERGEPGIPASSGRLPNGAQRGPAAEPPRAGKLSLRWRIAGALGVVAALVMAFGAIAAYLSTSQRLENSVDESLQARVVDLANMHGPGGPQGGTTVAANGGDGDDDQGFQRPAGCPLPSSFAPATSAQFIAPDGTRTTCIEGSAKLPVDSVDLALARSGSGTRLRTVHLGGERYRVLTVARADGGAFQLGRSLDEVDDVLGSLRLRLGAIGAIGVTAAALAGWLIAGRIVKPIDRLRVTAEDIARTQDLSTPIPTEGAAEIGSLGRSFTTMVDALSTSRREQQRLVSDASHELRTPLTSLRTNAELLARADELEPGEYAAVVEGVQFEVRELTDLMSELVELAGDSSGADETPQLVELADLAHDAVARAARRTGREIALTSDGATTVLVRPQMVERAIGNLVDNAIKYSDASAPVEVAVTGTSLEVRDRGNGFADADLPHVFDRFYRSVDARTQSGSGLGLAIVQQAVTRHGGRIWAANRADGGAAVGFALPVPALDGDHDR